MAPPDRRAVLGRGLVGVGAAQLGFGWGDPLAAIIIAAMLGRVAWDFGKGAVDELVDTQAPDGLRADLQDSLSRTPGVQGLRDLRMRQHGARAVADVSVMVDPHITVTEGHRIAEAARADALGRIDALDDLIIHVEPAGHFDGFGATEAPLRGEVEGLILTLAQAHPMVTPGQPACSLATSRTGCMSNFWPACMAVPTTTRPKPR